MLTAIGGYYNGTQIVMDENITLQKGQRVIITLDITETAVQNAVDLSRFMGRGEKMFHGSADEFVKELRENDRL